MMSYVKNSVGGFPSSLGGIGGSCARDRDLLDADHLMTALMSQLRLTESAVGRFHCQQQQQPHHQQQKLSLSFCCVPTRCKRYLESPIRSGDCGDAVRVICSNKDCSVSRWMHADCFRDWEHLMTMLVKTSVAGSGGSGRHEGSGEMLHGLELALRVCVCMCGNGYVRKDVSYYEETKGPVSVISLKDQTKHHHHHLPLRWRMQDSQQVSCRRAQSSYDADHQTFPGRVRTFSFSSTGSSPTSSTATPPPASPYRSDGRSPSVSSRSPTPTAEMTSQQTTTTSGNIFRHRLDLSAFRVLPKTVRNSYHIKVEDDGPHGNDKIRSFLLTNLTRNRIRQVHCAACSSALPVFDEFPLIDGTFFLSPRRYSGDDNMSVVFERRMVYLNAVCLGCLNGSKTRLICRGCLTPWDGSSLILGTMYSYDVFGAMSCCRSRLGCTGCQMTIDEPENLRFFSEYSRLRPCPHCQLEDYHFLKPLKDIFFFKTL